MQIIFGDVADKLRERFVVLELDTFVIDSNKKVITAWCVVEKIPLEEMSLIDNYNKIHSDLIEQYKKQNWEFCLQAVEKLMGKWNGELDSFYSIMVERINKLQQNPPSKAWNGYIVKQEF